MLLQKNVFPLPDLIRKTGLHCAGGDFISYSATISRWIDFPPAQIITRFEQRGRPQPLIGVSAITTQSLQYFTPRGEGMRQDMNTK